MRRGENIFPLSTGHGMVTELINYYYQFTELKGKVEGEEEGRTIN